MATRNISAQEQNQNLTRLERAQIWVHEHPTTTKILETAGLILGVGLLASTPFVATSRIVAAIGTAISGALLTLSSSATLLVLDILAPPHHDMKTHVFKPDECDGGKLYYEGDVPILSLDSDDPFKAGKAHGYLCGDAINRLTKRFGFVLHTIARQPRAEQLPKTLAAIRETISPQYLKEIEGLVEGYNEWAQKQYWWNSPNKLTVDDALLFHLIPDSTHFQVKDFERSLSTDAPRESIAACSAIVDRDSENELVFARNMDWPSFGLAGAYSLVIHRKHAGNLHSTIEVGVPGLVGTLTGMNDKGLSVAMNVCSGTTETIRGMPASLYNRACLEQCKSVDDVKRFTRNHSPLGAYHLTAVDKDKAESTHFFQSPQGRHVTRQWNNNKPLSTLNCRYNPQPNCAMHCSNERQELLDEFFQYRKNRPLEDALSLPFVNNLLTTHRVVMEPKKGVFRVAFDNAFAGKAPLQEVPAQRLFQRRSDGRATTSFQRRLF